MRLRHGETVTVISRAGLDRWGQPLPGATRTVSGCAVAPRTGAAYGSIRTTEQDFQAATVTTSHVLYAPYDAGILPSDVILRADGSRWHVDGDPGSWRSPHSGWAPGLEIPITAVTG